MGKFDNSNQDSYSTMKDIDEGLNIKIVEKWDFAFSHFVEGDTIKCYKALKGLFYMIRGYDFEVNNDLDEITETIDGYLEGLENTGKPSNEKDKIEFGTKVYEFKYLVEQYFILIPKAFGEIGKWLKIFRYSNDRDKTFSKESFGTDVSLVDNKKKEILESLTIEELVKFMNPNHIHHVHSRMLITKAVKEGRA